MIAESGPSPGCSGCMGVQKFHDESCRKRFERIYLHAAAAPTSETPVLARDEVPEASEAAAGAVAEEEAPCRASPVLE